MMRGGIAMNRLLDSNIVIYYSKAKFAFLTPFFTSSQTYVSAISIPEVFGFANLTPHEEKALHQVFRKLHTHEVTQSVLYKAAQLRRNKKIIVIDAIIAAT